MVCHCQCVIDYKSPPLVTGDIGCIGELYRSTEQLLNSPRNQQSTQLTESQFQNSES